MRELNRGGQIFFVHNRVHDIENVAQRLAEIVPEARIDIGHGQMPEGELERRDGASSSTASSTCCWRRRSSRAGWTFPTPTRSSSTRPTATAWPTCTSCAAAWAATSIGPIATCWSIRDKHLSPDAARRLRAIEEFSEMGAGFAIAMRDLEIRGAGNILGTQQSGHIAAVGYELYCELLEQAVRQAEEAAAARCRSTWTSTCRARPIFRAATCPTCG